MPRRQITAAALSLAFIASLAALFFYGLSSTLSDARDFYAAELRDEDQIDVYIGTSTYEVRYGQVARRGADLPVTDAEAYDALRIAYGASLARHAPLFGLTGTDMAELEIQIRELAVSQNEMAALQRTASERFDIENFLYPIRFLHALTEAERARNAFLDSASSVTLRTYQRALDEALEAYEGDLRGFTAAFMRNTDNRSELRLLDGIIDRQSILSALRESKTRIESVRRAHRADESCLRGRTHSCRLISRDEGGPQNAPETSLQRTSLSLTREVISILDAAHPDDIDVLSDRYFIALHGSMCAKTFAEPHYFLLRSPEDIGHAIESFIFVGDLLSYPLDPAIPREATFAFFSPTTYYLCPEFGIDVSRAVATAEAYVSEFPDADLTYASGRILDENHARAYARAEGQKGASEERVRERVRSMFNEGGAGLHIIVRDIVSQQRAVVRQAGYKPSTDLSASWNFFVRSAFPTLFLLHHNTMGPYISIVADQDPEGSRSRLMKWSEVRTTMPKAEVIDDIRAFLDSHREGPDAAQLH